MEFYYTYSDPLILIIISLSIFLLAIFLKEVSFYLRRLIPKKVKCWFCNEETFVPYDIANNWVCDKCEQYNGFKEDGDYNREIPNQYEEKFNSSGFTYQYDHNYSYAKNKLCEECNLKQQLKVRQLAEFVPMNEKNYDKEIEHFQKQIEKGFALCQDCEHLVAKVLHNVREDLSLPKRLSAAVSKINIRGERAIIINILLSLLLAFSSFKWELSLPSELKFQINQTLNNNKIIEHYLDVVSNHSLTSAILVNSLHILIGTGIFTNSLGFYQTSSPVVFLNIVSWALMFFLTLYPNEYEYAINILKIVASIVSMAMSILILLKNYYRKNKVKPSVFVRKSAYATSSMSAFPYHSRSPSVASVCSTPMKDRNPKVGHYHDNSPYGISSGMRNLSLGLRQRKGLSRPPLINPARFNPFSNISPSESYVSTKGSERNFNTSGKEFDPYFCKTSPLDRTSSVFSKSGVSEGGRKSTGAFYEPSMTPPSVLEGYDAVATIPSYPYASPCYPYAPTCAYYFSSQNYPKYSSSSPFPLSSTQKLDCETNKTETSFFWKAIYSAPLAFVFFCNLIFMFILYAQGK